MDGSLKSKDFISGILFVLFGAAFFVLSLEYEYGSSSQMGAGYFPRIVSGALIVLGIAVALRSVVIARRNGAAASPTWRWKPLFFVLGSMAAFAITLPTLGLVAAAIITIGISGVVAPGRRWREVAVAAILLATFSALVFVEGLGVFMPLFPWSR